MSSEAPLLSDSVGGEHAIQTERINMYINVFILNFAQGSAKASAAFRKFLKNRNCHRQPRLCLPETKWPH